jgi:SAM-dependent methyltransferase
MDLGATRRAFDAVATDYDGPRGNNRQTQLMRDKLRREVIERVPWGSRLLDLGCGTGLDVCWFAERGYRVRGIDLSPSMIEKTRQRIAERGLDERAEARVSSIDAIGSSKLGGPFDACYSNLGPLNCVGDLRGASEAIAGLLPPGGMVIASVIGRLCPWEIGYYLAHRRFGRMTIRFRRDAVPVPLANGTVWTRYFTPGELASAFSHEFHVEALRTLHLLRPPPYLAEIAERHPLLFDLAGRVEDRVAAWPLFRALGDSFLIVLRRTP